MGFFVVVAGDIRSVLFVAWCEDKLFLPVEAAACHDEYQEEQVDEEDEVEVGAAELGGAIRVRFRFSDGRHGELLRRRRLLGVS